MFRDFFSALRRKAGQAWSVCRSGAYAFLLSHGGEIRVLDGSNRGEFDACIDQQES